jgi:subtilisin family serine protease
MIRKGLNIILLLTLAINAVAQNTTFKYWVQFTDKKYNNYTLENPGEFLSQRAINRRERYGIPITGTDLPVSGAYLDSLKAEPLEILYTSKWMNAAIIQTEDSSLRYSLPDRSFITSVKYLYRSEWNRKSLHQKWETSSNREEYPSDHQVEMLQGQVLHQMGYNGDGMVIAVLDAGFTNVNNISGFNSLITEGRLLGTRSFVRPGAGVFWPENGSHGANVLSIMGGDKPGQFLGSAPKASYWLIQTEDISSEFRIEEANWIAGAELADSAGADIINTSLGYSIGYTDNLHNYAYSDMDGKTTLVTRAAQLAASRGILVVTSAGNSGRSANPWGYITAPADGDSVLAVGAVDAVSIRAEFSSRGPSYDRRIKPDVMAQGLGTWLISYSDTVVQGNGTSYSSPVIAGLTACLWQKNPDISNYELIEYIRSSSSQFSSPDTLSGYGIPNFSLADFLINWYVMSDSRILIYPNPASDNIFLVNGQFSSGRIRYKILDTGGRIHVRGEIDISAGNRIIIPVSSLAVGTYIITVTSDRKTQSGMFIKL